jgi:UDP-sulfoquinovose synthase
VAQLTGARVENVPDPRQEANENELHVSNDAFLKLGLEPITLSDGLLMEIEQTAAKYADRVDFSKIPARSLWTRHQRPGVPQEYADQPPDEV